MAIPKITPTALRALLLTGALMFFAAEARAGDTVAGSWTLTLAHHVPCLVTMTEDGALTPAPDCALGVNLARWKGTSDGIQLQTASGETYAVLKPKGADFIGTVFADQRSVMLSR